MRYAALVRCGVLAFVAGCASQAPSSPCADIRPRADVAACLEGELRSATRQMDHCYETAVGWLRELEAALDPNAQPGSRAALREAEDALRNAQSAWTRLRDEFCASVAASYSPGSGAGDLELMCHIELTRLQTDLLRRHFAPQCTEPR